VLGSRSSSETRRCVPLVRIGLAVCVSVIALGCATVRPEDKELLSEPAMTWGSGGVARAHERHVLDNREGATGGGDAEGGGCGCN
jgi:Domain of unknown function (DUF4266)